MTRGGAGGCGRSPWRTSVVGPRSFAVLRRGSSLQIEKRIASEGKFPEVNKAASDPELNRAISEVNAACQGRPAAKL